MSDPTLLETNVIIVGAGPAGIVLGNILLDHGIDCLVLDRYDRRGIYERGRAGVLESTTVAALERHGLADTIHRRGHTHGTCEFRVAGESLMFDYAELADGDRHFIYSQSDLNDDLIARFTAAGGRLLLQHEVDAVEIQGDRAMARGRDGATGRGFLGAAPLLAGCDGFHGVTRRGLPAGAAEVFQKQYPYRWLAVLAKAPPSARHVVYSLHADGFAAHMPRTAEVSRYYLQALPGESVEDWPDARVWSELDRRLRREGWTLHQGPIFHKSLLDMRSFVMEPMHFGRLLFAGDAAHIITPSGGKGLNLAVQDAVALAERIVAFVRNGLELSSFAAYSEERLPLIWRAQEFSRSMLHMLHRAVGVDEEDARFLDRISASKLRQLRTSRTFARDFARNYVGIC